MGPNMQASRRSSPQDPPTGPVCRQEPGCWEGPEARTAAMGHSLLISYWLQFTNPWLLTHLWSAYSNQISTLQAAFYLAMGRNLGKMCFPSHCSYPSSWFLVYNTVSFFPSDSCCKEVMCAVDLLFQMTLDVPLLLPSVCWQSYCSFLSLTLPLIPSNSVYHSSEVSDTYNLFYKICSCGVQQV